MNPPYTQMYISKCEICATFYRLIFKLKIIGHHFCVQKITGFIPKYVSGTHAMKLCIQPSLLLIVYGQVPPLH